MTVFRTNWEAQFSQTCDSNTSNFPERKRTTLLSTVGTTAQWSICGIDCATCAPQLSRSFAEALQRRKGDYALAKQREAELERRLDQAISQFQKGNNAQGTLRELESRAQTYHSMYESFLQRHTGGLQEGSFPLAESRLISFASALTAKVKPRPLHVFALSLMGGIALGVGVGLLRDLRDRVFRTRTQVQSLLQIPCIAMVPWLKTSRLRRRQLPAKASEGRTVTRDASVFWNVVDSPLSVFAESIRSIKLATHDCGTGLNKVIGLTSALPNEGKSTIAVAVAQLMAQAGRRVIIVDCDLRIPSLSRRLAPDARARHC